MKGYILSAINGTVQIGDTVFQPCTQISFKADRKGLKAQAVKVIENVEKTMEGARKALRKMEV
jgi:hypothetical protein